jgi:hypothetical protein
MFKTCEISFEMNNLEIFETVSYIMLYHANENITINIDERIENFEIFSIYEIF